MQKSADAFRTISEVADDLSLPQHVLRFWETRFPQIRPLKRAGGRRYYRPADISLLKAIRQLLYDDGYTIKGVQRLLKEQGAKGLSAGNFATEVDWLDPGEVDAEAEEMGASPPIVADDAFGRTPQRREDLVSRLDGDLMRDALEAIDECRRLLDAVLKPSR